MEPTQSAEQSRDHEDSRRGRQRPVRRTLQRKTAAEMKEREHAEDAVKKGNETDGSSEKTDIRKTDTIIDYATEKRTGRDSDIPSGWRFCCAS